MDDKQIALNRLFDTFINKDAPREFFLGLADYIDYMDAVPEFDRLTNEIAKQGQPLFEKENELKDVAVKQLDEAKKDIEAYVEKNGLTNEKTKRAFMEYESFREEKSLSMTGGLPNALAHQLIDVIEMLHGMPEHREFTAKYVTHFDKDELFIQTYLQSKELLEYNEERKEIEQARDDSLWGALNHVGRLYHTIKRGRELVHNAITAHRQSIDVEQNTADAKAFLEILNTSFLLDEWKKIEDGTIMDTPYFFRVRDVRFWITRIHNYVLSRSTMGTVIVPESEKVIANTGSSEDDASYPVNPRLIIKGKVGHLQLFKRTKSYPIGGINTRQFNLVRCLFNADADANGAYSPIVRTCESIFEAIRQKKDKNTGTLKNGVTKSEAIKAIIEAAIDELQKKEIGKYLHFERPSHKTYRLEIRPAEGKLKGS